MENKKLVPWWELAKLELKARGLSYSDVARKLGVEKPTVGHWMTGRREPPLPTLLKLSKEILGMSISELCGEDAWFVVEKGERKLLEHFRKMTPEERAGFLAALGLKEESSHSTTNKKKPRSK